MSFQFYIGASGSGKSTILYQEIIKWSQSEPHTNFLVIVPDQFTMQTQKDMVMMHPSKGIMNIDVLSFSRLSYRVFDEVGASEKPVLDDTGKSLILRKIASDLEPELAIIGKNLKKTGYIHEVKSAISEFMQYSIGEAELDKMIDFSQKRGALQYKLKDLKYLYREFTEYIKERFITTEETLDLLKNVLSKSRLIKNSVIVFDGFTGFTPVQNRVIQELMVQAKEVIMTITMDTRENPYEVQGEQKLFYLSQKTVTTMESLAKEAGVSRKEDIIIKDEVVARYKNNLPLAHLERELFRYPLRSFKGSQDAIHLFEASTPKEEIRQVCIKIKDLIRENDCAYRDIAVVTGDLGTYGPQVEEIFATYQIPFYLDQTQGIILNPFIEYIRSGLQIIQNQFSYESMFHFLRSGLTGFPIDQIDCLENYVLAAGIRGYSGWNKTFMRKSKAMKKDPEKTKELQQLDELRGKIMEKLSPLILKEGTMGQLVRVLYQFIAENQIQEKLFIFEKQRMDEGDFVKAKEFSQIYPLVMKLLEQMEALMGDEIITMKEFAQILDAGFGEIEVGTIPQNVDRVVVGDIERTRLKKIKVLFFMGLNDGIIPKSGQKGGIISDIDREFLYSEEWEMAPSPRMQMYIQKMYLYMNMTKPTQQLFLSFSKLDLEGKSIRAAYLIEVLCKLFPEMPLEKPQMESMEQQLETADDGLYYLVTQLRNYAAGLIKDEKTETTFLSLMDQYKEDACYQGILEELKKAAFFNYVDYPISKEVAEMLYGRILRNSVSRLEKFASCSYAHFLRYGMGLREREEFGFEAVDMGNVFHQTLEAFSEILGKRGYTWFDFPQNAGEEIIKEAVESIANGYGETILHSSARNEYAITRMERILGRTVDTLQYQLKKGTFLPSSFELSFSSLEDLESVNITLSKEEKMYLMGRIDRVDTYVDGESVYVKVIDYKSGKKDFDLVALYYGLQLQLVVYMNAALHLNKKNYPDKKVIPAAMLYYQIQDPLAEETSTVLSEEEINDKIRKQLRMTGMVNDDLSVISNLDQNVAAGSDVIPVKVNKDGSLSSSSRVLSTNAFSQISDYVDQTIKGIGIDILSGKITLNPFESKTATACDYCEFKKVCGYDGKISGYEKHKLEELSQEEAYEKIVGLKGESDSGNDIYRGPTESN